MPAEPDNSKIEELLKAYARKRRDEASNGFELHPAVRKMLQAEVARQKPKAASTETTWVSSLLRFWPRIAFAAAGVLVLSLVLWSAVREYKERASFEMAQVSDTAGKDFDSDRKSDNAKREWAVPAPAAPPPELRQLNRLEQKSPASASKPQPSFKEGQRVPESMPAEMSSSRSRRANEADKSRAVLAGEKLAELRLRDESNVSLKRIDAPEGEFLNSSAGRLAKAPRPTQQPVIQPTDRQQTRDSGIIRSDTLAVAKAVQDATLKAEEAIPSRNIQPAGGALSVNGPVAATSFDAKVAGSSFQNSEFRGPGYGGGGGLPPAQTALPPFNIAASPLTNSAGAVLAYDTSKQKAANGYALFAEGLSRGASPPATEPVPQPTPAPVETAAASEQKAAFGAAPYAYLQQTNRALFFRFSNAIARSQNPMAARYYLRERDGTVTAVAPPLASTFDVQQDGSQIRIIDSDGSIYQGAVLLPTRPTRPVSGRTLNETLSDADTSAVVGAQGETSFRVSGTNRTSQKLVVVSGVMTPATNDQRNAKANWKSSLGDSLGRRDASLPERFDATVQVDRGSQVRVQATRVSR